MTSKTPTNSAAPQTMASLDKVLRQAAVVIALGLLIELLSLMEIHPSAFLIFALGGVLLVAAGVAHYLLALLRFSRSPAPTE